jgi:hypothetical protein
VSRTVTQKTNAAGFPKPGELIEITGAHALEATDRAILNTLYQFAHDSGRISEIGAEWEIPLSQVRQSVSDHQSNDRLDACFDRLMRVIVNVPHTTPDGEPRILKTHLFDFFDLSTVTENPIPELQRLYEQSLRWPEMARTQLEKLEAEATESTARVVEISRSLIARLSRGKGRPTVRFGIPKLLQPLLAQSNRWGRIKAEVICAMTSKYAIALYELVQLRANMDRCTETLPIDRFRELLGVPPDAYERGNDFIKRVIEPAMLEVNGLSDTGVRMEVQRRNRVAPIEAVTVGWWRKQGDEYRAAMRERDRLKLGRMARLRGNVEKVTATGLSIDA